MNERIADLDILLGSIDAERYAPLLGKMMLHDTDTHVHLLIVGELSRQVSVELGLNSDAVIEVSHAALLHDIGKLDIALETLRAPRSLTPAEWEAMRRHPSSGAWMLRKLGEYRLANIIERHHERIDGSGYPDGLRGDEIPLASQIISVVDSYETMLYARPYKLARTHDDVIDELNGPGSRQLYDVEILNALVRVVSALPSSRLHALRK